MRRQVKTPPAQVTVTNGHRATDNVIPRDGAFEAHSVSAGYLGTFPSQREAAQPVARADRESVTR